MSARVTVRDLIDALEELDETAEVRVVHQENWPLQEVLGGIYEPDETRCAFDECDQRLSADLHRLDLPSQYDHDFVMPANSGIVYLVANGHPSEGSPYGDKEAWEGMRRL